MLAQVLRPQQIPDDVEDRAVDDGEPCLDRLVADGLGQVRLARPGRADEQKVAAVADELAGRQLVEPVPLDVGVELPVEVVERLEVVESRLLQCPADLPALPERHLVVDEQLQELRVVKAVRPGLLEPDVEGRDHPRQPQVLQFVRQLSPHFNASLVSVSAAQSAGRSPSA